MAIALNIGKSQAQQSIIEPAREVQIAEEFDVLVCGGGTSGFPAAVAASRQGARVGLIERYGFLGGIPSYSIMPAWHRLPMHHTGLLTEFTRRMESLAPNTKPFETRHMDPELVKLLALEMVCEAGVNLHLHTLITEVVMDGRSVRGVVTESKSGRRAFLGKAVIDATGDGDVCTYAGASFMIGRKEDGLTQGITLRFRMAGIEFDRYLDWVIENPHLFTGQSRAGVEAFRSELRRGRPAFMHGDINELYRLSGGEDSIFPMGAYFNASSYHPGELSVNATRINSVNGTREEDLTKAETTCLQQAHAIWRLLRNKVPGFEASYITQTATQVGVRESRCIVGDYTLTQDDCRSGREFDDGLVVNPVAFDMHEPNYVCEILDAKANIPYRCMLPIGLEDILVVGRCISADHWANSSIRMMSTAFQTGQVAGVAAAIAAKMDTPPRHLPLNELKAKLSSVGML